VCSIFDDIRNSINQAVSDTSNSFNRGAAGVAANPTDAFKDYLRLTMGGVIPELANRDMKDSKIELPESAQARENDFTLGRVTGKDVFYSPEMQAVAAKLKTQAKGYTPQEISAARAINNKKVEGIRTGSIRQVEGQAGKGQMGGARAAAMQGIADSGHLTNKLETERRLANDSAGQMRKGNNDAATFIMNQRFGELGTGLGFAGLGAADRASDAQIAIANRETKKGLLGNLLKGVI